MFRSPRLVLQDLPRTRIAPSWKLGSQLTGSFVLRSSAWPGSSNVPQSRRRLQANYATASKPPRVVSDKKLEEKAKAETLESNPSEVSTTSSTRHLFEGKGSQQQKSVDMMKDIKDDMAIVRDAVALDAVPSQPYLLGLAGTVPYLATSLSTLWLGWSVKATWPMSSSILNAIYVPAESAHYWLQLLEPIQIGYGAVIISFLGAIHWGMEYTEKTPSPDRTQFRYGVGVLAPAVAWPTMIMPVEYALITQFAAFSALYLVDSRAATRGWAPSWYPTYRLVLTFVVGGAIALSLIGRAKVAESNRLSASGIRENMHKFREGESKEHWHKLEEEEKEKLKEEQRQKQEEEKKKEDAHDETKSNVKDKTERTKTNVTEAAKKTKRDDKSKTGE